MGERDTAVVLSRGRDSPVLSRQPGMLATRPMLPLSILRIANNIENYFHILVSPVFFCWLSHCRPYLRATKRGSTIVKTKEADMQGHSRVVIQLNKVLTAELTSINQYFLHARMFKHWGLGELDEKCYQKSIVDMKQADELIARILLLEGLPNLQQLNKLRIGEHSDEMIACDLLFEMEQVDLLRQVIVLCENERDYVSRDLLQQILADEEAHIDWLEIQQDLIMKIGLENYQQAMMS